MSGLEVKVYKPCKSALFLAKTLQKNAWCHRRWPHTDAVSGPKSYNAGGKPKVDTIDGGRSREKEQREVPKRDDRRQNNPGKDSQRRQASATLDVLSQFAGLSLERGGLSVADAEKEARKHRGLSAASIKVTSINVEGQKDIARLAHGLDRVLFNPGVYYLQDPRSRVFNFDPYLQNVMPPDEFDYEALGDFIPPYKDEELYKLAKQHKVRFTGSTSQYDGRTFSFSLSPFVFPPSNDR